MTSRSPRTIRRPRDARTRDRLVEAQQLEAHALAGVCAAQEGLSRACAKRDAVVARANVAVEQARATVESAQAVLIRVSGIDRAALLLAVEATALRKVASSRNGRRPEE